MKTLIGKGAYKHYNAHYIPVVPINNDPHCEIYHPCQPGQEPVCDELVVFQKAQAIPRFWVELEVELPYLLNPSQVPKFVEDLIPHILKMLQNPEVDGDKKLRNILGSELAILLTLSGDDYLEEKQKLLFTQMTTLLDQTGKINTVVVKAMSSSSATPTAGASSSSASLEAVRRPAPPIPPRSLAAPQINQLSLTPTKFSLPSIAFGKEMWETYIGDVGVEPPLPPYINEILKSPCPFWSNKKVYETHILTLIPEKVYGRPLTLKSLEELVKYPKKGAANQYRQFDAGYAKDAKAPNSHWALMCRDVIPGTRGKNYYKRRLEVLGSHPYEAPPVLDAAVSILMEYFRSGGTRIFSGDPKTYTYCREDRFWAGRVAVGGFDPSGLSFRSDDFGESTGLAPYRKL